MTGPSETPARPAVGPVLALVLSMVVLPGLGQMLTGRLGRGALMAGAVALWMPVALIKVGRDISAVLPDLMARAGGGEAVGLADIQAAMSPMADGLTWVFAPLAVVWFWALADSLRYLASRRKATSKS